MRRGRGELLLTRTSKKLNTANERVPHTFSSDGFVRFGDSIVVSHEVGTIACNIEDSFNTQGDSVASLIKAESAIARNTFTILLPSTGPAPRDQILRYGVPFCIGTNASLSLCPRTGFVKKNCFLASELKSAMRQSRLSMKQEVYFGKIIYKFKLVQKIERN